MSSHAPGADPEGVSPSTHQPVVGYASLNPPTTLTRGGYTHCSNDNVSTSDDGHVNISVLGNQSGGVEPGFSAAIMNASLRSQLEVTGLLNSHNSCGNSPVHGAVSSATNLYPGLRHGLRSAPPSSSDSPGFQAAVEEDDIAAELILTRASPARGESPRSRFIPNPLPVFDFMHRSPVRAQAGPSTHRRTFSIPIPNFEIAPTIELPPSRDNSTISATLGENPQLDVIFYGAGNRRSALLSPHTGITSNYSSPSDFNRVILVGPLRLHHPRPTPRGAPSWARTEGSGAVSSSDYWSFEASIGNGVTRGDTLPVTSTPAYSYAEGPSFGYDSWGDQSEEILDSEDYSPSAPGPSSFLQGLRYPPEELTFENDMPVTTCPQNLGNFSFSFNHVRTGTLPPHPHGFLPDLRHIHLLHSLSGLNNPLPFGDGPSHYQGNDSSRADHLAMPYGRENSTSDYYTESSSSYTELIGNRSELSPFGPAIEPGPLQRANSSTYSNEPTRPVRLRPLSDAYITHGPQTNVPSPSHVSTEHDPWFDGSAPATPSPPSHTSHNPAYNMNAYSHPTKLSSSAHVTPENTLPEQVEKTEEPEEAIENEAVSDDGNEGDDEDESDNEDEYDQYFSTDEDESVDFECSQYTQASRPQFSSLKYTGFQSTHFILDYYSTTEGSAHSDDGHVGYTTDDSP